MTHSAAISRVQSILDKYKASVPELFADSTEAEEAQSVEQVETNVAADNYENKEYEYDVQIVLDKPSGGVDNEMLKFVIDKYSADGWKLHTTMRDLSEGGGQVVVVFERKYNNL